MGNTRQVVVGGVKIGGGAPVAIQSMSTFSPLDTDVAASQIQALHQAGADIIRVAVPDKKAAEALGALRAKVDVPLVADIHLTTVLHSRRWSRGSTLFASIREI